MHPQPTGRTRGQAHPMLNHHGSKSSINGHEDSGSVEGEGGTGVGVPSLKLKILMTSVTGTVNDIGGEHEDSSQIRSRFSRLQEHTRRFLRTRTKSWPVRYTGSQGLLQENLEKATTGGGKTGHTKRFIPEGELERIMTQEAVKAELDKMERSLNKLLRIWNLAGKTLDEARTICGVEPDRSASGTETRTESKSYRKIFAILLLIERPTRIRSFVEEGVCDADLPLVKVQGNYQRKCQTLRRKGAENTPLLCFHKWSRSTEDRFEEKQWSVLAPVFKGGQPGDIFHVHLEPQDILPFTSWEKVNSNARGCSQVYKAGIHANHHQFVQAEAFAVKELFSKDLRRIESEVKILKRLRDEHHAHDHLISLLATYDKGGHYYLIFPWAQFDLLGYWKFKNPTPSKSYETARWIVEQCQGLADGLSKIHRYPTFSSSILLSDGHPSVPRRADTISRANLPNQPGPRTLFGRHGDIKPSNILWFPCGYGILRITDFGISEFSIDDSQPIKNRGPVPNSPTYRPPECDLEHGELRPSYDIWALGCVYLEFITWYFGGSTSLEEFAKRRLVSDKAMDGIPSDTFFRIEVTTDQDGRPQDTARVKDSVTKYIDELRRHECCTEFFRDFLTMIEDEMLIIEENRPGKTQAVRKSSANIQRELATMKEKCLENSGYLAKLEDEI